jgi:hypothetical protein
MSGGGGGGVGGCSSGFAPCWLVFGGGGDVAGGPRGSGDGWWGVDFQW